VTGRPSYIVFGAREVTTGQEGARLVLVWAELARRYLNGKTGASIPPGWRGHEAAEWLYEQHRLIAERPAGSDGGESASAAGSFRFDLPASWPTLTVAEVAALRHVSEQAVRRALKDGRLAGERHGRAWAIREDHARMWMPRRPDDSGQDYPGHRAADGSRAGKRGDP
jgi:excisionase family DNA binding protein